ncbi:MAG: hypothetical protein ABI396_17545 [Ktedonobacteraceae bacterium]
MSQGIKSTVLLIEADASLRRLIVLGLQYRGMSVVEAYSPTSLPLAEIEQPGLLVVDVDDRVQSNWSLLPTIQTHPLFSHLPIIVLAWDCPASALSETSAQNVDQRQITYLAKPFDARALHATIEQLLVSQAVQTVQSVQAAETVQTTQEAAQLQEYLLALRTSSAAPSIFPLITAAGLLLAFIGLMGFYALTLLGIVVVMISLLAWTLGTGSQKEQRPVPVGLGNT